MHVYPRTHTALWVSHSNSAFAWEVTAERAIVPPLVISAVSLHYALWVATETYIYSLPFGHTQPSLSLPLGSGTEYPTGDMHRVNRALSAYGWD